MPECFQNTESGTLDTLGLITPSLNVDRRLILFRLGDRRKSHCTATSHARSDKQ